MKFLISCACVSIISITAYLGHSEFQFYNDKEAFRLAAKEGRSMRVMADCVRIRDAHTLDRQGVFVKDVCKSVGVYPIKRKETN